MQKFLFRIGKLLKPKDFLIRIRWRTVQLNFFLTDVIFGNKAQLKKALPLLWPPILIKEDLDDHTLGTRTICQVFLQKRAVSIVNENRVVVQVSSFLEIFFKNYRNSLDLGGFFGILLIV